MTDRHEHLDEGTIHAWLDGALPPDESSRVESRAESCAECAALVAEARGLIAASSRILSSLDAVPAGVIPGSDLDGDQLARLRARRQAATRRWWQDRRYVAAASLIMVAGVSSLVLRSAPDDLAPPRTAPAADSMVMAPVQTPAGFDAAPPVTAASTPAPVDTRAASRREAKMEAAPPAERDQSKSARVAAAPSVDSAVLQKAGSPSAPVPADVAGSVVANEARRDTAASARSLADSLREQRLARQDRVPEPQARQRQAGPRQAVQQSIADSITATTRRQQLGGLRLSEVVVTGLGAAEAAAPQLAGACFRLRLIPGSAPGRAFTVPADSLKLLPEPAPVRSDPTWFRTQVFGTGNDTTLAWRSVDPMTVELRARYGGDSVGVRFATTGSPPELARDAPSVRSVAASRILCP